jgi:hypothetical protein
MARVKSFYLQVSLGYSVQCKKVSWAAANYRVRYLVADEGDDEAPSSTNHLPGSSSLGAPLMVD